MFIPPRLAPRPSGVALVTIIMMVALMSFLIISVLLITTRHRQGAELYASGLEVRQLSDITVNTVIGQLRQATTHPSSADRPVAWVSQPGAIRTWQGADPGKLFKLYSSSRMVADIGSEGARQALISAEAATLATWGDADDPRIGARFTDLNRPVIKRDVEGNEELHFPIIDPRAAVGSEAVEGFDFNPAQVSGTVRSDGDDARLPMPVEWLYVLRDGSLGTLDPGTLRFIPAVAGGPSPTPDNPMVGRIAFWTDDESTKVNVNTASEGIPWDKPRADTTQERAYAMQQPVANEVQRFPGHPATTSLSSVLFPNRYAGSVVPPGKSAIDQTALAAIYDLVPRVSYRDGNNNPAGFFGNNRRRVEFDDDRLFASFDELLFDVDRGRSIVPFDQLRRARFFLTANSRSPEINVNGLPRVSLWQIDSTVDQSAHVPAARRTAFDELIGFATTLSTPEGYRYLEGSAPGAASDQWAGGAYHFNRMSPDSTHQALYGTHDGGGGEFQRRVRRNIDLVDYLVANAEIRPPGYSRSLDEKYGNSEPATGSMTISRRNARAAVQNMFGYGRSLNMHDTTRITPTQRVQPWGDRQFARGYVSGIHSQQPRGSNSEFEEYRTRGGSAAGAGPLLALGQYATISELAMILVCTSEWPGPGQNDFFGQTGDRTHMQVGQRMVGVEFLPEWFVPGLGFPMINYRFHNLMLDVTGTVRWQDSSGTERTSQLHRGLYNRQILHEFDEGNPDDPQNILPNKVLWGGSGGPEWAIPLHNNASGSHRGFYMRGSGQRIPIDLDVEHLTLENVVVTLAVLEGTHPTAASINRRIQNFRFEFPTTTVPVPNNDRDMGWRVPMQSRIARINEGQGMGSATESGYPDVPTGSGSLVRGDNPYPGNASDHTDVVRSLIVGHGDYRLVALHVNPGLFGHSNVRHYSNDSTTGIRYGSRPMFAPAPGYFDQDQATAHTLIGSGGDSRRFPGTVLPLDQNGSGRGLVPGVTYPEHLQPDFAHPPDAAEFRVAVPPSYLNHYSIDPAVTRDWDNGVSIAPDGAYWNKADEGARMGNVPYFERLARDFGLEASDEDETFSPNRILPSAVAFGSIPSLPLSYVPWTTFLFRPDLTPGGSHFGSRDRGLTGPLPGAPPDHLWLDLWWMPVVQPYAISEPFSTAGKINMNYQILPFTHITRATGLHAVLKSEEIMAIPTNAGASYKTGAGNVRWRHRIDPEETLRQWQQRFDSGDVFLTESEICEQFLVPFGQTLNGMPQFWQNHALTGDNTLERPYANLYPRLTTKSNAFRVHFKVQTFIKTRSTDPDVFDPERDRITAEFEGSTLIERYLEPRDPAIPDYVWEVRHGRPLSDLPALDRFYRMRVLETRRFAP